MPISITLKLCLLCIAAAFTEKEFNKSSKGNRKIKRNKKAYKCNLVRGRVEKLKCKYEENNVSVLMRNSTCVVHSDIWTIEQIQTY